MRMKAILFTIALVFAGWNVITNGINVRSVAIVVMVLVCLAMNVYNERQKQKAREDAEAAIREKEEIRMIRAEARRRQGRKNRRKK
ncbi:MAG: hypothetical protein SPI25_02505 [Dialister sp.]|nr:hypothetical protein [Dialister sp.]